MSQDISNDFQAIFDSPQGVRVFQHIMDICGYKAINPRTDHDGLLINETRRNLYMELRRKLPASILNRVETEI